MKRFRIAVLNAGAPAPGMNTAGRAAIRLGLDRGHVMLGVHNGFEGLIGGDLEEMNWMSVSGWAHVAVRRWAPRALSRRDVTCTPLPASLRIITLMHCS